MNGSNSPTYKEFLNEVDLKESMKKKLIDYVETHNKVTWKELHGIILSSRGLDPNDKENRGQFSSYFSGASSWGASMNKNKKGHGRTAESHGLLMRPTKKDPRYLDKNGKYFVVKIWDGKSKID